MEVSGLFHDPAALPRGKGPCIRWLGRLGGPQSRSGRGDEEVGLEALTTVVWRYRIGVSNVPGTATGVAVT